MTTTDRGPTQPQIRRLYTLASRAGWKTDDVHAELRRRYGVESTKALTGRQYEKFTAFLEGIVYSVEHAPRSSADPALHHPKVYDKRGCEAVLLREWPALFTEDPGLAANLVEVLDCFRLRRRSSGAISPRILAVRVQAMRKLLRDVLQGTVGIYLTGHTTKNENYFFGIARRLKYDLAIQKDGEKRQAEIDRRRQAEIDRRLAEILAAAGPSPVPPSRGTACHAPTACVCSAGRIQYRRDAASQPQTIPCPWCPTGLDRLKLALAGGQRVTRIDWTLIRAQSADMLEKRRRWDENE